MIEKMICSNCGKGFDFEVEKTFVEASRGQSRFDSDSGFAGEVDKRSISRAHLTVVECPNCHWENVPRVGSGRKSFLVAADKNPKRGKMIEQELEETGRWIFWGGMIGAGVIVAGMVLTVANTGTISADEFICGAAAVVISAGIGMVAEIFMRSIAEMIRLLRRAP